MAAADEVTKVRPEPGAPNAIKDKIDGIVGEVEFLCDVIDHKIESHSLLGLAVVNKLVDDVSDVHWDGEQKKGEGDEKQHANELPVSITLLLLVVAGLPAAAGCERRPAAPDADDDANV